MENEDVKYTEALARGDTSAFDVLYLKYAPRTEAFLACLLKERTEAEDITHDLFLKIWQRRESLLSVRSFGDYLFRMARNAVYDYFDSRAVREAYSKTQIGLPEYDELLERDIDNEELLLLIGIALEKMPRRRREIFRMSRDAGIANDEIAQQLHISKRTVENQISQALSELRKLLNLISFFI